MIHLGMAAGERISELRKKKGLSLRKLAELAGISPGTLSQVESAQISPSVATLEKIADGLRVGIATFFIDEHTEDTIEVFPLENRPSVKLRGKSRLTPLASQHHQTGFEPMLVHMEAGGKFNDDPYLINSSHAYAWVRHGEAVLEYEKKSFLVHETNSIYYDPRKHHNWLNRSKKECELLIVRSL